MTTLRIVNLNTWIGLLVRGVFGVETIEPDGHKDQRTRALVEELRERDPDVITLQECLPLPRFARQVATALDYDLIWRVGNGGVRVLGVGIPPTKLGRGEGLAILAKRSLNLRKLSIKRLSGRGFVNNYVSLQLGPMRYAVAAMIDKDGEQAIVCCTHIRYGFPSQQAFDEGWARLLARGVVDKPTPPRWLLRLLESNRTTRDLEIARLASWLTALSAEHGAPVVLGADFNLDPGAPQIDEFLAQTGYTNALPRFMPKGTLTWDPTDNYNVRLGLQMTFPDGEPKSMILQLMAYLDAIPQTPDHVMWSPGFEPTAAGLAFTEPRNGVLASDHYGIWADAALG